MSKYELPVLEVSDIPQLPFEPMNDTHEVEVALINQLGDELITGMTGNQNDADISEKLEAWVEHTRQHFARENELMENCSFPAIDVHCEEHQRVLKNIEELQQMWQKDHQVEPLAEFIFIDWVQWFDSHVNTMDMMTAYYLSQVMQPGDADREEM